MALLGHPHHHLGKHEFPWVLGDARAALAFGVGAVAIADPTLGISQRPTWHMLHKLTEHLGSPFPAGRIGADVCIAGEIQDGRKQACKSNIHIS